MDKFSEPNDNLTDSMNSLRGWKRIAESEEAKKEALLAELEAKDKRIADLETTQMTVPLALMLERLAVLERITEGVDQLAIDGGWTARGMSEYAKSLEQKLATPVRLPEKFSMLHRTDFHEDYHSTMAFKSDEVFDAIRAAGFRCVGDE